MQRMVRLAEKLSDWMAGVSAVILGLMTLLILVEILLWNTLTQIPLWIPQTLMLVGAVCFLIQLAGTTVKTFIAIQTEEGVV